MFTDTLTLDRGSLRLTPEGYLHVNAKVARMGRQTYLGSEVGRPEQETVEVMRPEAEVFSKDSLQSFAAIPITIDHPDVRVEAANWKDFAAGTTGEEVLREGEYIKIGLRVTDAAAIKAIEDGKNQLSVGYSADLVERGGGLIQTNIRANHIAIVDRARAGPQARIGDGTKNQPKAKESKEMTVKTIVVDGRSVKTTEAGADAIKKLQRERHDALEREAKGIKDQEALNKELAATKAHLEKMTGERDGYKAQAWDDKAIECLVAKRAKLMADVRSIMPTHTLEGMSEAEMIRQALGAKGFDVADKSDLQCAAMLEVLLGKTGDGVAVADTFPQSSKTDARQAYLERTSNGRTN